MMSVDHRSEIANAVVNGSWRVRLGILLFVTTIAAPTILGSGNVRMNNTIEAGLFMLVLVALGGVILRNRVVSIDLNYRQLIGVFTGFLCISTIALIYGLLIGNSWLLAVGDYYKFAVPILAIITLYLAFPIASSLERVFTGVHHVYVGWYFAVLPLYPLGILEPNQRLQSLYLLPIATLLAFWLRRRGHPVARISLPLLVASVPVTVFYLQSLGFLVKAAALFILSAVFWLGIWRSLSFLVGGVAVGGALLLAGLVLDGIRSAITETIAGGYLWRKLGFIVSDAGIVRTVVLLSGSRLVEPLGIMAELRRHGVWGILFGAGMGSKFMTPDVFGTDPIWAEVDHFVHSGLSEALLRTGVLGTGLYLAFVLGFVFVGLKIREDGALGALVAATAVTTLLFQPIGEKMLGTGFLTYAFYAYGLRRWTELRIDADRRPSDPAIGAEEARP